MYSKKGLRFKTFLFGRDLQLHICYWICLSIYFVLLKNWPRKNCQYNNRLWLSCLLWTIANCNGRLVSSFQFHHCLVLFVLKFVQRIVIPEHVKPYRNTLIYILCLSVFESKKLHKECFIDVQSTAHDQFVFYHVDSIISGLSTRLVGVEKLQSWHREIHFNLNIYFTKLVTYFKSKPFLDL